MRKRMLSFLLVMCLTMLPLAAMAGSYQDVRDSVVRIYVELEIRLLTGNTLTVSLGTGSAFAVGDGNTAQYFVTNRHVAKPTISGIEGLEGGKVSGTSIYVVYDEIENMVPARIVAVHPYADLAIVAINTPISVRKPATLGQPTEDFTRYEGVVYTAGFPAAADTYDQTKSTSLAYPSNPSQVTLNQGVISRVITHAISGEGELIQHNATMNSGNSGGPLVKKNGTVIGVNTYSIEGAEGTFASVSVKELIPFLKQYNIPFKTESGIDLILIGVIALVVALALGVFLVTRKKKPGQKAKAPVVNPDHEEKEEKTVKVDGRILKAETGYLAGRQFPIEIGKKVYIGRDPSKCQIVFPADALKISRVHCWLKFDGNKVTLTDSKSTCGTFVDGNPIPPNTAVTFHRGQKLAIGSPDQVFSLHTQHNDK